FGLSVGTSNFTPPPDPPPCSDDHADANAAARFLTQATFGPDAELIAQVQRDGYSAFLDQQFAAPVTLQLPYVNAYEVAHPGTTPNENYAREVLQLFTIGLNKLNPDGTLLLDNQNRPIPTYDQTVVVGMAHIFTGWYWTPGAGENYGWDYISPNFRAPMLAYPDHHDTGQKRVLDNVVLPAGQSQTQDLKDALDIIFNHPNVGPFVCRHLIQHLVTSNPSPAYVYRVAKVFKDNGQGVRGDLRAVVRAILLDYEARNQIAPTTNNFGHEREPVIRYANLLRAFHASAANGIYALHYLEDSLGQNPLRSPTVFNF